MPTEERQDFLQFLSGLLSSGRADGELRDMVRAALSEDDRFRQWQNVLDILEKGERQGLFRAQGIRDVRGTEYLEFTDLVSRRSLCLARPPVMAIAVTPRWQGSTFRLPVPLPTSEASLAEAVRRFLEEETRRKLGADLSVVYLVRDEKGPEFLTASRGEGFTVPSRFLPVQVDRWTLGRGLAVVARDLKADAELARASQRGIFRSVAVVPLAGQGGRTVGVLEAWSRRSDFFAREELGVLASMGQYLADLCVNAIHLKDEIFRDDLTGIFNRRYFDRVLLDTEMLRSRRTGREFALLFGDVDDFKRVNDRHGHTVGDRVLHRVACLLAGSVRPHVDLVSRYGGEEFAVLLPEIAGTAGARTVAERLRSEVAAFDFGLECPEITGTITLSFGGALYQGHPETPEQARILEKQQLIERADQALYHAKRTSKNCVYIWDEGGVLDAAGRPAREGSARA